MSTLTITEFLEARIAEDEALATSAIRDAEDRDLATWEVDALEIGGSLPGPQMTARFSPARVLAECAAKRAIIEFADQVETMDYQITNEWGGGLEGTGDNILKALAAVYASHADYREERA